MTKRYVWLNIENGEFSNSWTEEEYSSSCFSVNELAKDAKGSSFKLISYECLSDEKFEFNRFMKIR